MKRLSSHNLLASLSNAFLASPWQGIGYILLLFSLCFLGVHITKFAVGDRRTQGEKTANKPTEPSPEKAPQIKTEDKPTPPEPVYYIVERKRRRSKPSYGEPKEIRFK